MWFIPKVVLFGGIVVLAALPLWWLGRSAP